MTLFDDYLLLLLAVVMALGAVFVRDLLSGVLILAAYSFFLALLWAGLGAVDVAFTEAVVGAGLSTVFFFGGLVSNLSSRKSSQTVTGTDNCIGEPGVPGFSPIIWVRGSAGGRGP